MIMNHAPANDRKDRCKPCKRSFAGRFMQLQAGLSLYGVASALRVRANLGLDPWGAFHQGVSRVTGLSFGTTIILVGAIILLLWIPLRQKPGIGTISNILVIGLAADAALALLPEAHGFPMELLWTTLGTALTGVAGAIYISADFGTGPRDGLMMGIAARTGWGVGRVRGAMELSVFAIGWSLGAAVGAGTIIHVLLIGWCLETSMGVLARHKLGAGSDRPSANFEPTRSGTGTGRGRPI
jgi:uncharacterized membrane protein YczE